MNRWQYREACRYVRYYRNLEDGKFFSPEDILSLYQKAIERCPTGSTRPWSGSMYAQFPEWQTRRMRANRFIFK